MKKIRRYIMTVIIFSIAAMSNKTCSMDDKENELSLTRYMSENWKNNKQNITYFLYSALQKNPRYCWKISDYLYDFLNNALCCWCYQYDNDEEHSQAIGTSFNNATKYCNENETI